MLSDCMAHAINLNLLAWTGRQCVYMYGKHSNQERSHANCSCLIMCCTQCRVLCWLASIVTSLHANSFGPQPHLGCFAGSSPSSCFCSWCTAWGLPCSDSLEPLHVMRLLPALVAASSSWCCCLLEGSCWPSRTSQTGGYGLTGQSTPLPQAPFLHLRVCCHSPNT